MRMPCLETKGIRLQYEIEGAKIWQKEGELGELP